MNSSLSCDNCKKYFNLNSRKPIVLSCCQDILCKECWSGSFNHEGRFQCPFACGQQNTCNPQQPMINKYLTKKLETEVIPADIFCDLHPNDYVLYYNKKDHKLECGKCVTSPVKSVRADRPIIDKTCKKLMELIDRKMGSLNQEYQAKIQ
jgi:hypothetical protein